MTGFSGHGPLIENRQQTEHVAVGIEQRRPKVAFDSQFDQELGDGGLAGRTVSNRI